MRLGLIGTAIGGALSCICVSTFAADSAETATVIVTATRAEQSIDDVIGSVTVITRADIEHRSVQSTQELLRGETGFNVVNSGGLGKLTNVFLRGADAEQVLVLVNGVRVGSATSATTAFEFIPVDQIERIEIVRGPRSSIYGADAVGGVIQIFTRNTDGFSSYAGAGSHETYTTSATLGFESADSWLTVSGSHLRSDGYNSCLGSPLGGGCWTFEPDDDGYENSSGSLRAGHRWGERAEIEASALYASGETEYDSSFSQQTDFIQNAFALRSTLRATENLTLQFIAGVSNDDQDVIATTSGQNITVATYDTERRNASLQADLSVSQDHLLTVGSDYVDDRVDSSVAYDRVTRDNLGVFALYQGQFAQHQALLSARYDDNEQFGAYRTANAGWRWNFSERISLYAAAGSAFGAPSFNDLYFPGASNPDLDPESSASYELGLIGSSGAASWSVGAFENHVDDLIVWDSSVLMPRNLSKARIRGLELEARTAFGAWIAEVGYAALDPRNRDGGINDGNWLPRRARHSGRVELGRAFGPLDARVRVTAESSRFDDVGNRTRLGSYAVVDLVADYRLSDAWSLQAKLANLLDRDYQTVHLYAQEDRSWFMSVRYQPAGDR